MNYFPKINDWSIIALDDQNPCLAPELRRMAIAGFVTDRQNFKDGDPIITSTIKGRYKDFIVTKSGSMYSLGDPNKEYEKQFPNALNRLLTSLTEL